VGSQTRIPPGPSTRVGALRPGDPRRVGGYRLTGLLGEGGMGQVFLGRSRAGRALAVKVIHTELAADLEFRRRFANELAAVRAVSGIYTAAVVVGDPEADQPWLATAYIEGPTLAEAVASGGPMAEDRLRKASAGIAEALTAIHGASAATG